MARQKATPEVTAPEQGELFPTVTISMEPTHDAEPPLSAQTLAEIEAGRLVVERNNKQSTE